MIAVQLAVLDVGRAGGGGGGGRVVKLLLGLVVRWSMTGSWLQCY